jgi:hypothetical protein
VRTSGARSIRRISGWRRIILPHSPDGFFNSINLLVGDFRKGSSFALGESALVLQDKPYPQRCSAIRHIDDIENRAKGSIECH